MCNFKLWPIFEVRGDCLGQYRHLGVQVVDNSFPVLVKRVLRLLSVLEKTPFKLVLLERVSLKLVSAARLRTICAEDCSHSV
jgi:hypothetical protein